MTNIQAGRKVIEKEVYNNLQDWRVRQQPKFKLGQLVRTADIKRAFSKGDSTNYSYNPYTITEVIHETVPSYEFDYLPERYNENLLLPTNLTLEENNQVMKGLKLIHWKKSIKRIYSRMKLLKIMLNIVDILIEILFYHTNMNGLATHAYSTQSKESTNLQKYNEKK